MKLDKESVAQNESDSKAKTYRTPELVEYGSIAKLTQGGGATVTDGGGMLMSCL